MANLSGNKLGPCLPGNWRLIHSKRLLPVLEDPFLSGEAFLAIIKKIYTHWKGLRQPLIFVFALAGQGTFLTFRPPSWLWRTVKRKHAVI